MKANELMVDDWVQTKEVHTPDYYQPSYKRRVAQINDFGVELFFLDRYGNKCYGSKKFDHIEPIPLTAEILENNGWEYEDCGSESYEDEYYTISDDFDIHIGYNGFYEIRTIDGRNIEIKYVHELQHVLKLCGIDKEIEL